MDQKEKKYMTIEPISDGKQVKEIEHKPEEVKISNFSLFMKVGIIVLSIITIIGFGIKILPNAITVTSMSSKKDLPIYCVDTDENKVALSFDAAWGNEDTEQILTILDKYEVKATFFMTGSWVEKYPEEVKAIANAGHDLGNHSENHKQMSQLTKTECVEEIMKTHYRVKDLTGIEMKLFRPPYGDYNNTLVGVVRDCGYCAIQWDVDSLDWKDYGVNSIIKMVVENKQLGKGSIILMHDGARDTPEALESVIKGLQNKGYDIVPISQLIIQGEYTVDNEGRQIEK